jgi:hypothetical protein
MEQQAMKVTVLGSLLLRDRVLIETSLQQAAVGAGIASMDGLHVSHAVVTYLAGTLVRIRAFK